MTSELCVALGDAREEVQRLAQERKTDLLVIGIHGHHKGCPVLTVRSQGS